MRLSYNDNEYDYIIVGMGAAGSVLAARLAEDPSSRIAVVEAGDNYLDHPLVKTPLSNLYLWDHPSYQPKNGEYLPPYKEWIYKTAPQYNGSVYKYPRGAQFGGSASHHSLVAFKSDRTTFDEWVEITQDPIWSYENIQQYYNKTECNWNPPVNENNHGRDGWLHITKSLPEYTQLMLVKAGMKMGMPFAKDFNGDANDPTQIMGIGYFDMMVNKVTGERSSGAKDLLMPILSRHGNITIIPNSLTTKIIIQDGVARGIEYEQGNHNYGADTLFRLDNCRRNIIYASKEVILCAGAINTPQLLMLSGIGCSKQLNRHGIGVIANRPGVGKNLLDHMEATLVNKVNMPYSYAASWPSDPSSIPDAMMTTLSDDPSFLSNFLGGQGPYSSNGIPAGFDIKVKSSGDKNPLRIDLHVHSFNFFFAGFNLKEILSSPIYDPCSFYHTFLLEVSHPEANSGTISLRSADPHDMAIIDERLWSSDRDVSVLAEGIEISRQLGNKVNELAGCEIIGEEVWPGAQYHGESLKEFLKSYSAFGHHICGTCRMGQVNDNMAVVDSRLKVIGVSNLRIVDASIFPTITSANPCWTVYAVAELAADMIKDEKTI